MAIIPFLIKKIVKAIILNDEEKLGTIKRVKN